MLNFTRSAWELDNGYKLYSLTKLVENILKRVFEDSGRTPNRSMSMGVRVNVMVRPISVKERVLGSNAELQLQPKKLFGKQLAGKQ